MEKTKDGIKCDSNEVKLELIRSMQKSLCYYADDKDKQEKINKEIDFWKSEIRKSKTEIMEKTKDAVKQQLKEQWKKACMDFLDELLRMWELDAHYGYWIGNEEGCVYDYGDGMFTINMDGIIYCVLGDITREQYIEWQEYCCEAAEFGFDTPNLRSWIMGCPRTPQAVFDRLRGMKAELDKAVEEEKQRIKSKPITA